MPTKASARTLRELQDGALSAVDLARTIRGHCDESARGRSTLEQPERRAALVSRARADLPRLQALLDEVKSLSAELSREGTSSDGLLAEALVLSAILEAQRARRSLVLATRSLARGVGPLEAFFGKGSPQVKHLRRVLARHDIPMGRA